MNTRVPSTIPWDDKRIFVRIRVMNYDVSCYFGVDGRQWTKFDNSTQVTEGRSVSLYAAGEGEVVFRNLKYRGLE